MKIDWEIVERFRGYIEECGCNGKDGSEIDIDQDVNWALHHSWNCKDIKSLIDVLDQIREEARRIRERERDMFNPNSTITREMADEYFIRRAKLLKTLAGEEE